MSEKQAWIKYFFLSAGLSPSGDPAKADVIIVPSFGRNHFKDSELYQVRKLLDDSHGFDFLASLKLKNHGFDPGRPNLELAKQAQEISDTYNLPLILQWEIAASLDQHWFAKNLEKVFCLWPPQHQVRFFTTYEFSRQIIHFLKKQNWQKPILVVHKHHIVRAYLLFKKLGLEPIIVAQTVESFDSKSVQHFTRNKVTWHIRELLTRVHHLLYNYVDLSGALKKLWKKINHWLDQRAF